MPQCVHTVCTLSQRTRLSSFRYHKFWVHILQVPFEWLTLQIFAQFQTIVNTGNKQKIESNQTLLRFLLVQILVLTFRMEYSLLTAQPHSNTACNRPSILRRLVSYFWRKHFHCLREMCTDAVYGKHDQLGCMVIFLGCRRIAIHGMKFPNFRRLQNIKGTFLSP